MSMKSRTSHYVHIQMALNTGKFFFLVDPTLLPPQNVFNSFRPGPWEILI